MFLNFRVTVKLGVLVLAAGFACMYLPAKVEVQTTRWYVWMKTTPCSGRTDWVSVAKENPADAGGLSSFVQFPGSHSWPTFEQAMAEADQLRQSSNFSSYCCHDKSVYKNRLTGKSTVLVGDTALGGDWQLVKGGLCCDEAAELSGIDMSCSSGALHSNTVLNGTTLKFQHSPTAAFCKLLCTANTGCRGYTWIHEGTYNPGDPAMCYLLSSVTSSSPAPGHYSAMKSGLIPGEQEVPSTPGTGGGNGNSGDGCTADEAAAFARMVGAWHTPAMTLTIGGTCAHPTGRFSAAEDCSTGKSSYGPQIYTGSFTDGKVYTTLDLGFSWTQAAGPSYGALSGHATCGFAPNGTLTCEGFKAPCFGFENGRK